MQTTWQEQLRGAGLRVTRPRLSVLQVLAERPHADVDTIVTAARDLHPTVSPQAVYGVLEALVAGGAGRRIERAGAPGPVEPRVGDNSQHPVCPSRGAGAHVDCPLGVA